MQPLAPSLSLPESLQNAEELLERARMQQRLSMSRGTHAKLHLQDLNESLRNDLNSSKLHESIEIDVPLASRGVLEPWTLSPDENQVTNSILDSTLQKFRSQTTPALLDYGEEDIPTRDAAHSIKSNTSGSKPKKSKTAQKDSVMHLSELSPTEPIMKEIIPTEKKDIAVSPMDAKYFPKDADLVRDVIFKSKNFDSIEKIQTKIYEIGSKFIKKQRHLADEQNDAVHCQVSFYFE